MKLGIDFLTSLLCTFWDRLTISIPFSWKGILKKKVFVVSSVLVMFTVLCRPSLKLARSFIISGIYFGILCSKSRSFASSMGTPSFLCNKLNNVLSSCTNPGLLQLLTKFLNPFSRSVCVILCFLFRFCAHFLNFLGFFIKKWPHYSNDIFCALLWDIA